MTYQQSVGPYLSTITVTNISKSFAYKMAAKINWQRYGTIITLLSPYRYLYFASQGRQMHTITIFGNVSCTFFVF